MMKGIFGVINNIICLYSHVKKSEAMSFLTRRLFELVKQTHTEVQICNPAVRELSENLITEIESRLDQILNHREWTWDKILADVKNTCGSAERLGVKDIVVHPEKVAKYFQVRFI